MKYRKMFKEKASEKQLEYAELAEKILGYCSMGCVSDYTDDVHLEYITNALIELNDAEFVEKLRNVETDDDYIALDIPDNEMLRYYMEDGKDNTVNRTQ